MNYGRKRNRPQSCPGWTRRFRLNGDNLYITLNTDEADELFEVFIRRGKAGSGENCYCEALARMISLALRYGANPKDIAKQLRGLSGPEPIWEGKDLLLSVPHCAALAIDEWLQENKVEKEK